jgi:hypothetical protein
VQSSVGGNGAGLTDILPNLNEAVGAETPNADTAKLDNAATAWSRLATTISQTADKVTHGVKRPDPSLPDATAFYDTIVQVTAPGDALSADAQSLSSFSSSFSAATGTMRQQISSEVNTTALLLGGSAAVSILATRVVGAASISAEVSVARRMIQRAGDNIRGFINALRTAAAVIDTFRPVFQAAMKAILDKNSLVPAEGFERNPDGTIKPTIRYFDRAKWEAWQRYLERGGDWDIDKWSKAYDQLRENFNNGWVFDRNAAEIMGYTPEDGWKAQYSDPSVVPGRRWDYANPALGEYVENKSGRLDFDQLALDEEALQQGVAITYNINANYPYSSAELAALQRIQDEYPKFTVNRI